MTAIAAELDQGPSEAGPGRCSLMLVKESIGSAFPAERPWRAIRSACGELQEGLLEKPTLPTGNLAGVALGIQADMGRRATRYRDPKRPDS